MIPVPSLRLQSAPVTELRLIDRCRLWQLDEHGLEIHVRLDAIGICRLDQAVQIGAGIGTGNRIATEPVFAADDEWPNIYSGSVQAGSRRQFSSDCLRVR